MQNVIELPRPIKPLAQLPVARGESKHSRYINILAKMAACVEPVAQARIAACIVYRNDIVSFGICKMKSHPFQDRKSTRLNSSHMSESRMPSSA